MSLKCFITHKVSAGWSLSVSLSYTKCGVVYITTFRLLNLVPHGERGRKKLQF